MEAISLLVHAAVQHGVIYIEVGRGTMTTSCWIEKVEVYRDYIQSNKLLADWRSEWAILLAVTPSEKRLMSIAQKTVAAGGKRGFWFTTADSIAPGTVLEYIWIRGIDLFHLRNEQTSPVSSYANAERTDLLEALR